MPKGGVMGVPGDIGSLAASGVLSAAGLARLPLDHVLPRTKVGDDVAVGTYVAARLGHEVVDRLVDPLLGGVYAGNAYEISLRAAIPQLYESARSGRSLIEAVRETQRRASASAAAAADVKRAAAPVFAGIRGGVGRLPVAVAEACRAMRRPHRHRRPRTAVAAHPGRLAGLLGPQRRPRDAGSRRGRAGGRRRPPRPSCWARSRRVPRPIWRRWSTRASPW